MLETLAILNLLLTAVLAFLIWKLSRRESDALPAFMADILKAVKEEISENRRERNDTDRANRQELSQSIQSLSAAIDQRLNSISQSNDLKMESVRGAVETQLEKIRNTVNEKLQETLNQRLGESFKQVSERLEQVHNGLGEMKNLAAGVGDLKKVLSNVKTRGTFGEVQLATLLEQVMAQDQYAKNISTKNNADRVEFAIKFPGRDDPTHPVYLPIDAKFPLEDYQRLLDARENADPVACEAALKQLELRVKTSAKDISTKYISPPNTTDIAILFLPTEGLFAEVVNRPGLLETLQRDFHILVAGPTTLLALLNSFQLGFQTLAIEKRSSEVWKLLTTVKIQFQKYEETLVKVLDKLHDASNTIETDVATRVRVINKSLREVQDPASSNKDLFE